ncbi:hypothetical protein [Thalassotalea ganghwensis]
MNTNTFKKLAVATTISSALSVTANAADVDMSFAFTTVPDVAIVEQQAMNFGNDFTLAIASTCNMQVESGAADAAPGNILARMGAALAGNGANYQAKTGDCDQANPGVAGIYKISGAKGVLVDITVNGINAGGVDFSYLPEGCYVVYNNASDGDVCTNFTAGTGNTVVGTTTLATDADTIGNTSGSPIAGEALIFLGGTITAQNTLTAGSTYVESFTIDVVYQ